MTSVATKTLQSWQASPKEGPVCLVRSIDDDLMYLRCVALGARPRPKAMSLSISGLFEKQTTGFYIEEVYTVHYDICVLQEFGDIILAYTLVKNFYIGLWVYRKGHVFHGFGLIVDREWTYREARRLKRRLKAAKLKESACVEDINYRHNRGLDCSVLKGLASGQWIGQCQNVIIIGPTGSGKTYFACALANQACRQG